MTIEPHPHGVLHLGLDRQALTAGAPLVSVIVTNYNYGRFLEACLANIATQSYPNIECIVVDDASTDNSYEVLDEIILAGNFSVPGRSLHVIKLHVNAGMAGAACEGLKRSTGSYVIFFDADDIMLPHLIEAHVTAFFYSRIGVCISSADMFYQQRNQIIRAGHPGFVHFIHAQAGINQQVFRQTPLPFLCGRQIDEAALELSPSELYHLPPDRPGWAWGATSALCFRREMVERMLARVPKISGCLDAYLLCGIHPFTGAVLIDRPLVIYRIHEKNDWIKFAPIENFMNWDIGRETGLFAMIAREILLTHLLNAEFYARSLYNNDTFIHAVEWLYSDQWSTKGTRIESFSVRNFLTANEARLRSAFGDTTYRRWVGPYKPAGWIARKLWRNDLLKPMRKLLYRSLGDTGLARLRASVYR